jgi:restriction endonuclease S subunit
MRKRAKIGELAEVRTGYSFRGAVVDDSHGMLVVQAKDVKRQILDGAGLPKVSLDFPSDKYVQNGDVLLTSRGAFRAGVARFDAPAIASSSLFILHPSDDLLMSEFLALYLNSSVAQSYMRHSARGATILSLNIDDLLGLIVPILPVEQQRLLVSLQQNIEKQIEIMHSRIGSVNKIYNGAVYECLKGVMK